MTRAEINRQAERRIERTRSGFAHIGSVMGNIITGIEKNIENSIKDNSRPRESFYNERKPLKR